MDCKRSEKDQNTHSVQKSAYSNGTKVHVFKQHAYTFILNYLFF